MDNAHELNWKPYAILRYFWDSYQNKEKAIWILTQINILLRTYELSEEINQDSFEWVVLKFHNWWRWIEFWKYRIIEIW